MQNDTTQAPRACSRIEILEQLSQPKKYDLAIIGGGATGLGVALDAAARGLSVVLLESDDFARGTSSRSTKLVHGGVRYLAQGNVPLVYEAVHERATILHNAPHIAQPLAFVMPCYKFWELPFFGIGLVLYDALAGKRSLGRTRFLNKLRTRETLSNVHPDKLKGGVQYWDGQFDDARLALALARTAAQHGALLVNYCKVTQLTHEQGRVSGLIAQDRETKQSFRIEADCVINATGVWVDEIRQQDTPDKKVSEMVAPSQGVHVVVDRAFLPGDQAMIVPHTSDGRVLFAVPWLGKVIIGTTDTPRHDLSREPDPFKEELDFILRESKNHLQHAPTRADIKSIWVGLRPLVKPPENDGGNTKKISRGHTVIVSASNLVTVTGGKWTTYRAMAIDVLKHCQAHQLLPSDSQSMTQNLPLVGAQTGKPVGHKMSDEPGYAAYGDESGFVQSLPGADHALGGGLTEAMVRFAARYEYALCVEDILARRSRMLFLDAKLAHTMAEAVGAILAEETGLDPQVEAFKTLALHYLRLP